MKSKYVAQALLPAALWACSLDVHAQIITIGFAQDQGSVASVPVSPWMTAAIAVMLALTAWAFLRRKGGTGMLLLALALTAGGLASKPAEVQAVVANPGCTALVQLAGTQVGCISLTMPSPKVTTDFAFINNGAFGFVDVVNNSGVAITLASVGAADGASGGAWVIVATPTDYPANFNVFAPTCAVGLHLAPSGRCSLYLRSTANPGL